MYSANKILKEFKNQKLLGSEKDRLQNVKEDTTQTNQIVKEQLENQE